jgi:two-component system response regulator AlgR
LNTLKVIIVDDEALARQRLRRLLSECTDPAALVVGEAADAVSAMQSFKQACDVLLLDIHLPGTDGLKLAQAVSQLPQAPLVVFVTAHTEHAVAAFDLEALDYLTKPVRLERLQAALKKAERQLKVEQGQDHFSEAKDQFILIQDRGRSERVPLGEVLYLKAELKYITVRTRDRTWIADGALADFEQRHGAHWLRIHRNALVARHAIRALLRQYDHEEGDWAVRLDGVSELLTVSRRQLPLVREALAQGSGASSGV